MKFRLLPSPRLILRFVKATERIATTLEDIRNVQYRIAGIPTPVHITDDDTPEDATVTYTDDRTSAVHQHRARTKLRDGFFVDTDDLGPAA